MKTSEQYIEDMKHTRSDGKFVWEPCHMKVVIQQALQAQHEATWAMALEAAAFNIEKFPVNTHGAIPTNSFEAVNQIAGELASGTRTLPCPPLTPKESTDE